MVRRIECKDKEDLTFLEDSTLGPYTSPIATIKVDETIEVETWNALTKVTNPVTGPIYVEDAEPGDTLIIDIIDVELPDEGTTSIIPGFGALEGWLNLFEAREIKPSIRDGFVQFPTIDGKEISVPVKPFVGTIGVSPAYESINTLTPGRHGGNMDCADVCPGNRLMLPVSRDGALFSLGDVHAVQGDGEVCGTAVEVDAVVKLRFDLIKQRTIGWPRIESDEDIMAVGSAKPLEDAAREAYRELIEWMQVDYGWQMEDVYMFLSIASKARIAQIVDPLYTVVAKISKRHLEE
ncbi:MAG: acetamidase/formamidase family protein [Candidatus Bathyarchaeia archaeon]